MGRRCPPEPLEPVNLFGREDALRIAAEVFAEPARAVSHWKALTGRKAVGCLAGWLPEEVIHAAGMLPVGVWGRDNASLREAIDGWVVPIPSGSDLDRPCDLPLESDSRPAFRFAFPEGDDERFGSTVGLLDRIEELCGWAEGISGRKVTEGALEKAVRAYNENRRAFSLLEKRMSDRPGAFTALDFLHLAEAGLVLPKEAHTALLGGVCGAQRDTPRAVRARVFLAGGPATAAVMRALDAADAGIAGDDLTTGHRYFTGRGSEGGDMALSLARTLREKRSSFRFRSAWHEGAEGLFRRVGECRADRILMLGHRSRAREVEEAREIAAGAEARRLPFLFVESARGGNEELDLAERISSFTGRRG